MLLRKISYRKTGGFAGIMSGVDISVDTLADDEGDKLQQLFERAKLPRRDEKLTPGARDMFHYSIAATTTSGEHEVKYDDVSLPGALRPLVEFLDNLSTSPPSAR